MELHLTDEQLKVLCEVVDWAIEQLDMDNMTALAYLKEIQDKLPEPSNRILN